MWAKLLSGNSVYKSDSALQWSLSWAHAFKQKRGPAFHTIIYSVAECSLSVSEYLLVSTSTFEVFEKTAQNHKKSPFVTNTTHTTIWTIM